MSEIGLFLSSEEHGPRSLVEQAQMGEEAGFSSVFISDHFHPWVESQGESPFVWSVIGGVATTTRQRITTGVTCPTFRFILRSSPRLRLRRSSWRKAVSCSALVPARR